MLGSKRLSGPESRIFVHELINESLQQVFEILGRFSSARRPNPNTGTRRIKIISIDSKARDIEWNLQIIILVTNKKAFFDIFNIRKNYANFHHDIRIYFSQISDIEMGVFYLLNDATYNERPSRIRLIVRRLYFLFKK